MKKQLLLFAIILLPLVASAHDIEVQNADGVTIYYNYINDGTELEVTFGGDWYYSYSNEYHGNVAIPEEVTYMNRTRKVTSIGNYAFEWCTGLTSITIPNSVTSIGNHAFYYCYGLKKVIVLDIAAWCGIKFDGSYSNPLFYAHHLYSDEDTEIANLIIPNSVTSIETLAFEYCYRLTSVTIPNSVTSIGSYAFENCSRLTSVTIGNSVTSIGSYAFENCSRLTSVTIGSGVTSIGSDAFENCSGLKKVIVKDIAAWCGIWFDGSYSNPLYYARHIYSDEDTEITNLIIPNSVTSIGDGAFSYCSGLTSVTIGSGVSSIGNGAFAACSGLTSVTIPNSVTSIGYSTFSNCSGLTSITIGNSVTSIGDYAFYGCSKLTSVTIPNSVTSIGNYAFYGCKGLTSVTIPNSVTSIGNYAFQYCSGLTSVTIPNSVTSIGDYAFWYCYRLTSVTIGNGVTSIGNHAFDGNRNLSIVVSLIENPFSISYVFGNYSGDYSNNATLYVPIGTKEKYQATDGWKDFVNIVEGTPTGIKVIENTQNKNATVYDLNGVRLPAPKKGINIINGQKVVVK